MKGPHQGQPVRAAGAPLDRARALVVLVHGRGATAESILGLAYELDRREVAYLAPQAGARVEETAEVLEGMSAAGSAGFQPARGRAHACTLCIESGSS